jgi:hypothetical protein
MAGELGKPFLVLVGARSGKDRRKVKDTLDAFIFIFACAKPKKTRLIPCSFFSSEFYFLCLLKLFLLLAGGDPVLANGAWSVFLASIPLIG